MKAAIIEKRAQPGEVASVVGVVEDWPAPPEPAPGEVQVKTLTSALNHMDLWVAQGIPGLDLDYPRITGCDGCGVIQAVGAEVGDVWMGRRVIFNAAVRRPDRVLPDDPTSAAHAPNYELIGEHFNGAHRERFNVPVANIQDVGEMDPVDSAGFGLVGLTAYGLFRKADLHPGESVLITGVGGGVATIALSLCKWMGAKVCVTSRHQWKLDRALKLGADHAVLDAGEDWSKQVREWTNKRGVDVVFDSIGQAVHMNCIASMGRGGRFVTCGNTSGPIAQTHLGRIFWNQLRILGSTMGTNDEFAEVVSLFRSGFVRPVVDSVYKWNDAAEAWKRLEGGEQFGKVVLRWSDV